MADSGIFVSFGSNLDPRRNVLAAARTLAARVRIVAVSTVYATEPLDRPEQVRFYNGVFQVETALEPRDLKYGVLRAIEAELGRERTEDKYAARTIDLDLILYNDLVLDTQGLVIPDPDLAERPFLALPLYELAPGLILPDSGRPLRELVRRFAGHDLRALPDYTTQLRKEVLHGPG